MNWVDETISAFGQSIGIPTLALDQQRKLRFKFENGGSIALHHLQELSLPEVLVIRSEPLAYITSEVMRQALRVADFRVPSGDWQFQVGCNQRDLFLGMRIPERAFAMNVLEQALVQLSALHERFRNE